MEMRIRSILAVIAPFVAPWVAGAQNLYLDYFDNTIVASVPSGTTVSNIAGSTSGSLGDQQMAYGPNGLLYVANDQTEDIETISPSSGTTSVLSFTTGKAFSGITYDSSTGLFYALIYNNGGIYSFAPNGSSLTAITTPSHSFGNFYRITSGDNGYLYLDGGTTLYSINESTGLKATVQSGLDGGGGLTSQGGNLYVGSKTHGSITELSTSGTVENTWSVPGSTGDISGIAVDSAGNIFAMDQTNGTVYEFVGGGATAAVFNSGLAIANEPNDLTVSAVPEPTSCLLWAGIGALGLVALRQRRAAA